VAAERGRCVGEQLDSAGECIRRAELRRDGLVEWWLSEPRGLEQGWTIDAAPAGRGPLVVEVAVEGMDVGLDPEGQQATFSIPGARLYYGSLLALDARQVELDAWLEPAAGGLRVVVDDAEAVYPVVIDPLLTSAAWNLQGDYNAQFGGSVASAGDVNGDGYDDIIVGAARYTDTISYQGGAFVFHGSSTGLSPASSLADADWIAAGPAQYSYFGNKVAGAGDVNGDGYADVIVGSYRYANGQSYEGGAFLWYGSSSGLAGPATVATADWTVEGNQGSAYMGGSVAGAGDLNSDGYDDVIVAAYSYDDTLSNEGGAFVWYGSSSGLGGPADPSTADWTAVGGMESVNLGWSLASAGDVNGDGYDDVVIGAPWYDTTPTDEGIVVVWHGSASGLPSAPPSSPVTAASADWMATAGQAESRLGYRVASAGDVNGDGYDDVIAGATYYDDGEDNEGHAFVWHGSSAGLPSSATAATAAWSAQSNQVDAYFGYYVASAGDVDGDGFGDVLVGATEWANPTDREGGAFLWHGSSGGLPGPASPTTAAWSVEGGQNWAYLAPVASADVNSDGVSDAIIGAGSWGSSNSMRGKV